MFTPPAFEESDPDILHGLMRENSFALLVSNARDGPLLSHLPVILDRPDDGPATLYGHMARANPHWRALERQPRAVVVFSGPHAYVSPSWYASAPAVPTWNYLAVHAHGNASLVVDPAELDALLARMVKTFEDGRDAPWRYESLPEDYRFRQIGAIVGFRLPIDRLEGKLKLSQNRPAGDAARVAAALAAGASSAERETAAAMRRFVLDGRTDS